jgi:hypothetical protein
MDESTTPEAVSLLWPDRSGGRAARRDEGWRERGAADLGLTELAQGLSIDPRYTDGILSILLELCDDPEVIAHRQAVFANLLAQPALAADLEALLPSLLELAYYSEAGVSRMSLLHQAMRRLSELEMYVDCVNRVGAVFERAGATAQAGALQRLRARVAAIRADDVFQRLNAELPKLGAELRSISSVTIGVNLDPQLLPVEATLLGFSSQRYKGASHTLLGRLFGRAVSPDAGMARLHSVPFKQGPAGPTERENPLLVPLFHDLNDVLETAAKPLIQALKRYLQFSGGFLMALVPELAFYLGALRVAGRLRAAGLPVCLPELAPPEERAGLVRELYNPLLALRMLERAPGESLAGAVVCNDAGFGDPGFGGGGRIFILTGPNRGGKTTYTQAVGLAQVLCQAGLFAPGSRARLSPVDAIHTHFQGEERLGLDAGRLGEEARRLGAIFERATRRSLVLMNESLSSTSPAESFYLARDVVRAFRALGARVIYSTHLHELAAAADDINAHTPGDSAVASLVSQVVHEEGGARRTYRIAAAPPAGSSFARDIAQRYGISYEQLREKLAERRTLDHGQPHHSA